MNQFLHCWPTGLSEIINCKFLCRYLCTFMGSFKKIKLWSRNVLISSDPARHPLLGNTVLCATFGRGTLTDIYFFGYTYSHLGGMCTDSAILSQSQSPQSLSQCTVPLTIDTTFPITITIISTNYRPAPRNGPTAGSIASCHSFSKSTWLSEKLQLVNSWLGFEFIHHSRISWFISDHQQTCLEKPAVYQLPASGLPAASRIFSSSQSEANQLTVESETRPEHLYHLSVLQNS